MVNIHVDYQGLNWLTYIQIVIMNHVLALFKLVNIHADYKKESYTNRV